MGLLVERCSRGGARPKVRNTTFVPSAAVAATGALALYICDRSAVVLCRHRSPMTVDRSRSSGVAEAARSSALAFVATKHGDGAIGRADEHDHARREEETVLDDAGDALDLRTATTARRPGGGSVTPSRDGRRPMCRASSPACVATAAAAVGSHVS